MEKKLADALGSLRQCRIRPWTVEKDRDILACGARKGVRREERERE